MADSKIEWCDKVWNAVRGCTRVSPGCANCYAERQAIRHSRPGGSYAGLVKSTNGHPQWTGKIRLVEEKLREPIEWRKPQRIFVNSMSDLFHDGVPDKFIDRMFAVMAVANWHTYQILTKRAERMMTYLQDPLLPTRIKSVMSKVTGMSPFAPVMPLKNVWLGVSVEDQPRADERIPLLLQTPAAVRWISAEPLLGPIDLTRWINETDRERGVRLSSGFERRFGDRDGRNDMADTQARMGQMEEGSSEPSLQTRPRGKTVRQLSSSSSNDQRSSGSCSSSQVGLQTLQESDSSRIDSEPRRREEDAQPSRQSHAGDVYRATDSRHESVEGWTRLQSGGRGKLDGEIDELRRSADPDEAGVGREIVGHREGLRGFGQDGVEDRPRPAVGELSWCVIGGESGPGARHCELKWIESIIEQCKAASVACFVKQLGAMPVVVQIVKHDPPIPSGKRGQRTETITTLGLESRKGGDASEWPERFRVRQYPAGARG
jgi:protein gp37